MDDLEDKATEDIPTFYYSGLKKYIDFDDGHSGGYPHYHTVHEDGHNCLHEIPHSKGPEYRCYWTEPTSYGIGFNLRTEE